MTPPPCASRGRKVRDAGRGLASRLACLFVHILWRNFFDRFLLLAGKPIGYTHDNAEKAKADYNHHDAHNTFISYLEHATRLRIIGRQIWVATLQCCVLTVGG